MRSGAYLLILLMLANCAAGQTTAELSIIPQPVSVKTTPGSFVLSGKTKILADPGNREFREIAEMLATELNDKTGYRLAAGSGTSGVNAVLFTTQNAPESLGEEGYQLSVKKGNIVIRARKGNGAFYAMQTLLQLLPTTKDQLRKPAISIPTAEITDMPRFKWRGLMLDVARYYYSMNFLKKYIDYLAMHKMNIFHWPMVQDHGWRLEIKKHPDLTEIAGWRTANQFDRTQLDNTPKGGFYTQAQARELIDYAAKKYVTIIPEIQLPGHTMSALIVYPELSCTGGPFKTLTWWGIQKDIYCAGNEKTFAFLEEVLSEVAQIFPSKIIHIGGDEAPKDRWKACPKCQKRIKDEGLKDEHELQSYFIKRIEKFLLTKGKNIIGWDEILEGGLAPNAAVMSWRGIKGGIEAAKQHNNVVMTPTDFMYLDYYQGQPHKEPITIGGLVPLHKVYSFEPIPKELTSEESQYIMGVQGNVWGEFIHSPERAEYMTYPRAAAVAEVGWVPAASKNWEDFTRRMEAQYQRYDLIGLNYAKSAYDVWQTTDYDSVSKTATISFKTDSYKPEIRYTLDGNEPTQNSTLYNGPFKVKAPILIKAATFKGGKQISKINEEAVIVRQNPRY